MSDFLPQRINLSSSGVAKILGEAEAKILEILWKREALSVRDVADRLASSGHVLSFNATMTILNRLVAKRVLVKKRKRTSEGRDVFLYTPQNDRATFLKRICHDLFAKVFRDERLFSAAGFAEAIETLPQKDRTELAKMLSKRKN